MRIAGLCTIGVGLGSVNDIACHNILGATKLAMARAIQQVLMPAPTPPPVILIDGRPLAGFPFQHQAQVKGDSRSLTVALASVVAKVTRDRYMVSLGTRFPAYGYDRHAGYGTATHRAAISKHGPSVHHRTLFLRNIAIQPAPDLPENSDC